MAKYVRITQVIELSQQIFEKTDLKIKILHMANGGHIKIAGAQITSVQVSTSKIPTDWWHDYPHTSTAIAFPHFGYQKVVLKKKRKMNTLYFFKIIDNELQFIGSSEEEAVSWVMAQLLTDAFDWDQCKWIYQKYYCDDNCPPEFDRIFNEWILEHWGEYFCSVEAHDDSDKYSSNLGSTDNGGASDWDEL